MRKPERVERPRAPSASRERAPAPSASGDLREQLLVCTETILREDGLAFVSLRAVARLANVSHGAPAYHFRSKAGLLTAFAARGYRLLVEEVRAELDVARGDPREQLQAIGRAYVRFAIARPELFAIMFRGELHERGNRELAEASDAAIALLSGTVGRCVRGGHLAPEKAEAAGAAAWSIAHGLAELWLQGRLPARTRERDPARLTRLVLELFVSSIMPDRSPPGPRADRAPRPGGRPRAPAPRRAERSPKRAR